MSVYIDRKFLLLISARLRNFKQKKEDLYNFSCPYCGDSHKNLTKARGYVYRKGNDYFYMCHNCNVSTTFSKFLQYMDAEHYKEYVMEKYTNGAPKNAPVGLPDFTATLGANTAYDRLKALSDFPDSLDKLPDNHYAKAYIRARGIPEKFWNEIYYVENYKEWLDTNFPTHGKENLPSDARIVLFYTDRNGGITNVTGRALAADNKLRYVTVKIREEKKVYGLHRLDTTKRIYITEGQFDSLFLPNAVASGDSNLIGMAEYLKANDIVLVYDNQPRNKDIVKQIRMAIEANLAVSLLPYDTDAKDINEMVKGGMKPTDVQKLIDNHVYSGLTAQLHFNNWRKC